MPKFNYVVCAATPTPKDASVRTFLKSGAAEHDDPMTAAKVALAESRKSFPDAKNLRLRLDIDATSHIDLFAPDVAPALKVESVPEKK